MQCYLKHFKLYFIKRKYSVICRVRGGGAAFVDRIICGPKIVPKF